LDRGANAAWSRVCSGVNPKKLPLTRVFDAICDVNYTGKVSNVEMLGTNVCLLVLGK
jgi:hypothetical protein